MVVPRWAIDILERHKFYRAYHWGPLDLGLDQFDAVDARFLPIVWKAEEAVRERRRQPSMDPRLMELVRG